MAKISKLIIEKILETAKIEEVVSDFIDLKKKGVRYLGLCPFHEDRSLGSFVVYPSGSCYKCFSCGAKGGVVDFLMNHAKMSYPDAIRYLGKKYNIETDDVDIDYTPPPPKPAPPPLPTLELPKRIIAKGLLSVEDNTLVKWIRTGINWDVVQRSRIDHVLNHYAVGNSQQGMAIFWLMDEQGQLRTGKMMRYTPDGHRDRSGYNFDWIHSALARPVIIRDSQGFPMHDDAGEVITEVRNKDLYDEDKQEMVSCYYGLQLLDHYKRKDIDQTICIVESEKTALLMAIAYGNNCKQMWMACGGLENLSREKMKPLIDQHRPILLYPDRDGIDKWRMKAEAIGYDRLTIDTRPVTEWWQPQDGDKADIADVVIRITNERKPMTNIDEVKAKMPEAEKLIDKLNLTIESET